jgi:hypothetical protein
MDVALWEGQKPENNPQLPGAPTPVPAVPVGGVEAVAKGDMVFGDEAALEEGHVRIGS